MKLKSDIMNKTIIFLLIFFTVLIWSVVNHFDYFTWFLEAIPAIPGVTILAVTYNRFKFANMTYIFDFKFDDKENPDMQMYWKGKIYAEINSFYNHG